MAIMKVRKIGSVGVIKDLPSFDLPPEAWTHANNVRFLANRIEKIGGYMPVLMEDMPEEPPLAILSRNNTQDQIYGTADSLYLISGRQHMNVSKLVPNPLYVSPTIPNPEYDSRKEIANPDYDPEKTIVNPDFNTNKPEDNNKKKIDPNKPGGTLPNPAFNPSKIPNTAFDDKVEIPNPDYNPGKPIDDKEEIDDPNNPGTNIPNPGYNPVNIPNPAYDPNKEVQNPNFDPFKPEDNRERIEDPSNPPTWIDNPDYNPKKIDNPKYNPHQMIPNPDYEPLETLPNPSYNPDDPVYPETLSYKYDANPDSTWYYTTLSNAIVLNTPLENPQGLVPYKAEFEDIPGWGYPDKNKRPGDKNSVQVDWKAGRIRSYRNYLIALDMTEGGVSLPQRVRWSNVAYVNELPPDWIENDEAKDGGFNDMTDANGAIVDGMPLRDSFVIYTDQETYLMEYVGGIMIFNFKKLFSDSGILAPECAVEFDQKHFVITKDDIFVHNGSSKQAVASGRVKQYLIDEISSVNPQATKVFAYTPQKEIWITYVGPGQTASDPRDPSEPVNTDIQWTCNKAAVWNWEWDTWYFVDIPPSFDINMAPPPDLTTPEWEEFFEEEDYWDSPKWMTYQWSELGKDFIKRIPYIASPDKCLYTLDVGDEHIRWIEKLDADGHLIGFEEKKRPVVAELLRTHLDMDEMVENTRSHKFIRHITPQFRGFGNVHCYVGGAMNPTNEPDWDNWQIFDIEEDVKVDAFSNNRYPAIKFLDLGKGQWSFQGFDIDFVVEGTR